MFVEHPWQNEPGSVRLGRAYKRGGDFPADSVLNLLLPQHLTMAEQPNFEIIAQQFALMPNLPIVNLGGQLREIRQTLVQILQAIQQQGQQLLEIHREQGQLRQEIARS